MGSLVAAVTVAIKRTGDDVGALLERLRANASLSIEAGFTQDTPPRQGEGGEPSMLQVAAWNEFGTKTSPPRPFMRQTIPRHKADLRRWVRGALKAWVRAGGTEQGIARVGVEGGNRLRGAVQETITRGDFKPNADLTKMIKGSRPRKTFLEAVEALRRGDPVPGGTRPLIDTGQMRQGVRWQMVRGGRVTDRSGEGG